MTECIGEIEDTRKDMYKVAKQMVRMKDSLINQRHQKDGAPASNYGTNQPNRFGISQIFKKDDFLNGGGAADTAFRNTIGSPLKTNPGDVNPFQTSSPNDYNFQQNP